MPYKWNVEGAPNSIAKLMHFGSMYELDPKHHTLQILAGTFRPTIIHNIQAGYTNCRMASYSTEVFCPLKHNGKKAYIENTSPVLK